MSRQRPESRGGVPCVNWLEIIQRVGSTAGRALFAFVLQQRLAGVPATRDPAFASSSADVFAGTFGGGGVQRRAARTRASALATPGRRPTETTRAGARGDRQPLSGNSAAGHLPTAAIAAPT